MSEKGLVSVDHKLWACVSSIVLMLERGDPRNVESKDVRIAREGASEESHTPSLTQVSPSVNWEGWV